MMQLRLVWIFVVLATGCTLDSSSRCPGFYTPDDSDCAASWCREHPLDTACVTLTVDSDASATASDSGAGVFGDAWDGSELDGSAWDGSAWDGSVLDGSMDGATLDAGPECRSSSECAGRADGRLQCSSAGSCVVCETNSACATGVAPRCANASCTGCMEDLDCTRFASTPVCGPGGQCVACRSDAALQCTSAGQVCASAGNTCVECNAAADCHDKSRPVCEGQACRACKADAECASTGEVCHESTGRCVACEPNAQDPSKENCANGNACDPKALTCTGHARRSIGLCGQTTAGAPAKRCASDSECKEGRRCVMTNFPSGKPYGAYCLQPAGGALCPNRYRLARDTASVLGVMDTYCFPNDAFATCESLLTLAVPCTEDSACGAAAVKDGLCRGNGANKVCTYGCDSTRDCSNNMCTDDGYCALN